MVDCRKFTSMFSSSILVLVLGRALLGLLVTVVSGTPRLLSPLLGRLSTSIRFMAASACCALVNISAVHSMPPTP